ncbi:hypothetical protein [Haloimpatiens lingqiaonensis]|uniref:hypothetical protein n=1 Tax=Haloimpatiens lingqiaonensis TaxID=1380675 RepID=UPI0010FDA64A|nr:hypothetical protein [Haloimpatiens lingqiaonensis]
MREVDKIVYITNNRITINIEKFYDNLKLSLKYNGQEDQFGIYAKGRGYFRNAILEMFESLNKGIYVYIDNQYFVGMESFKEWLYSDNNLQLGIIKHKEFIDIAYDTIKEKGLY